MGRRSKAAKASGPKTPGAPFVVRHPSSLSWDDVDPATHPFVAADAEAAIARAVQRNWGDKRRTQNFIDEELHAVFGAWSLGWRWARDEGSYGGGPVTAWCCAAHSVTTPDETAQRAAYAMAEWQRWIRMLAARFDDLAPSREPSRKRAIHAAVVELVADVVEKTAAGDAWYNHCRQVLTWYLERHAIFDEGSSAFVDEITRGVFQSWVAPADDAVDRIAHVLAKAAR